MKTYSETINFEGRAYRFNYEEGQKGGSDDR